MLAALLVWQWDWVLSGYNSRDFSLSERLWTQLRVLWSYAGSFIIPRIGEYGLFHDDLVISHSWLSPLTTAAAAISWLGLLVLVWLYRVRYPWLACGVFWFLVAHSMESSVLALEMVFVKLHPLE